MSLLLHELCLTIFFSLTFLTIVFVHQEQGGVDCIVGLNPGLISDTNFLSCYTSSFLHLAWNKYNSLVTGRKNTKLVWNRSALSLKITDFTISMYGSSCNSLSLLSYSRFFYFYLYFLVSFPALGMPINTKRKQMSNNEALKGIPTWTASIHGNGKIRDYYIDSPSLLILKKKYQTYGEDLACKGLFTPEPKL